MTERKPVYFWMRNLLQKLDATTKCGVLSCHSCTTSLIMHFTNWNGRKKVVVSGSFRCWRIRHAMQATYALLFCELEFIYIAKVDRYKKYVVVIVTYIFWWQTTDKSHAAHAIQLHVAFLLDIVIKYFFACSGLVKLHYGWKFSSRSTAISVAPPFFIIASL